MEKIEKFIDKYDIEVEHPQHGTSIHLLVPYILCIEFTEIISGYEIGNELLPCWMLSNTLMVTVPPKVSNLWKFLLENY